MDAASHRGIDDVRVLRDAVKLAPVSGKKKIYIIDEAHMLTTEASNALLKTLEEPPEHVVFILATTNPEKLIETIRSRTTYIPFRKATTEEIINSLKRVVTEEKIKVDDGTLGVIAEASDGSFRDGIKILEQLVAEEKDLTKEFLEEFLFNKKAFDLDKFIGLLVRKDTKSLIEETGKLSVKGVAIDTFLESLLKKLQTSLLAKVGVGTDEIDNLDKESLINLIELFTEASADISASPIEELPLEVAIIRWCEGKAGGLQQVNLGQNSYPAAGTGLASSHSLAAEATTLDATSQDIAQTIDTGANLQTTRKNEEIKQAATVSLGEGVNDDVWRNILALIKPLNASIEALLRAARPISYDGKILTLGVYYKFHKERLEDEHHRRILEDVVAKVLQSPTKIVCTLVEPPPKKVIIETKVETVLTEGKDADIIKAAEEIFGT
jgi:DNA polymerase-3 subunit gamma/tau